MNTFHEERGANTVTALTRLFQRLSPDVVFAEIPPSHVERYANGTHGTLESRAVAAYGRSRRITVVPVDRPEPPEEFFQASRALLDEIERRSRDYRALVDQQSALTASGGLRYLNSAASSATLGAIRHEVRASIDWMRAPHLHSFYDHWLQEIELRDREMIANITAFASECPFPAGVFVVGAAHRQSLIEKIGSESATGRSAIEWQVDLPAELLD